MLALVHSRARGDVRLLTISPQITWLRADGRVEVLSSDLVGAADFASLQRELMGRGLLVAEYLPDPVPGELPEAVWILRQGAAGVC